MSTSTPNMGLKKAEDTDNARTYLITNLGDSLTVLDSHDHTAGLGIAVKRILAGTLAARPAGTAGWIYYATDTNQLFCHDGDVWNEITPGTGSITTAKLADGAVTTIKIVDGAVTSAKIADGTIVDADISASAAIAQSKISNATRAIDADMVDGAHAGTGANQVLKLDGSGNAIPSGYVTSAGMRVHRTPYNNNRHIEVGSVSVGSGGGGCATTSITFTDAFSSPPIVVAVTSGPTDTGVYVSAVSTTGATVGCCIYDPGGAWNRTIYWLAEGPD